MKPGSPLSQVGRRKCSADSADVASQGEAEEDEAPATTGAVYGSLSKGEHVALSRPLPLV